MNQPLSGRQGNTRWPLSENAFGNTKDTNSYGVHKCLVHYRCKAGNFYAGFFENISPEQFRAQMETNFFGPTNVTRGAAGDAQAALEPAHHLTSTG